MRFDVDMGDVTANKITAYEPGKITINDKIFLHNVIVSPEQIIENWTPVSIQTLAPEHVKMLLKLQPEVVLLGTGEILHFPDQAILLPLTSKRIGVEVMTTRSACFTYNVLMAEGRKVVAALINESV